MSKVMLVLGGFPFWIHTTPYQQLTRESGWNWPEQEITGGAPKLQYTGKIADKIDLSGTLAPEITGDRSSVEALRLLGDVARPLPLISGQGLFLGMWVIERLVEGQTVHYSDGVPRLMNFQLSLKKYADSIGPITQKLGLISRAISIFG